MFWWTNSGLMPQETTIIIKKKHGDLGFDDISSTTLRIKHGSRLITVFCQTGLEPKERICTRHNSLRITKNYGIQHK